MISMSWLARGRASRRGSWLRGCALGASLAMISTASGQIPLRALSHSVTVDRRTQSVQCRVLYNRPPDFFTVDSESRQADSFQLHLDTAPGNNGMGGTSPYPWETIARGEEIHRGGGIRIRNHVQGPGNDAGAEAGGWGPVLDAVPYSLSGARLTFQIPLSMLRASGAGVGASLEVYRYGTMTQQWAEADCRVTWAVPFDNDHVGPIGVMLAPPPPPSSTGTAWPLSLGCLAFLFLGRGVVRARRRGSTRPQDRHGAIAWRSVVAVGAA